MPPTPVEPDQDHRHEIVGQVPVPAQQIRGAAPPLHVGRDVRAVAVLVRALHVPRLPMRSPSSFPTQRTGGRPGLHGRMSADEWLSQKCGRRRCGTDPTRASVGPEDDVVLGFSGPEWAALQRHQAGAMGRSNTSGISRRVRF